MSEQLTREEVRERRKEKEVIYLDVTLFDVSYWGAERLYRNMNTAMRSDR